jgi:hypothetical protein
VSRTLREEMSISLFKKGAKKWVKEKIPIKPGKRRLQREEKRGASAHGVDVEDCNISMKKNGCFV